ncbi:MAG: AmmeMemoRadiSam system protein B [Treponema sp.]|nr:AmmeMemoRadiSam system protein B [Treponema sp.]
MQIREYSLPAGWFPRDANSVSGFLSEFKHGKKGLFSCQAAIAPHAGWYYCGKIAAIAFASLKPQADTIIILGGHLPAEKQALFAMEDALRTPFGQMSIDNDLRALLIKELGGKEDCYRDNTVEVLLPMAHYFFPNAKVLWLRLPADIKSYEYGKIISKTAVKLGRDINVIASADLTHYGRNYGFSPKGTGSKALDWVRDVNDAAFIKAVESGDAKKTLFRAEKDFSSCSPGAVLGVMGFAHEKGLGNAKLLEYSTSADIDKETSISVPDSFVGYAAMAFGV